MASTTRSPRSTPPHEVTPQDELAGLDEIIDLTDRRRVLLVTLFGVEVPPDTADAVFGPCRELLTPRR